MAEQARDIEQNAVAPSTVAASTAASAREPELASRALARIQQCIEKAEDQRHRISASGALSSEQEADIKDSFNVQIKSEIAKILAPLHPADIAYILEALPTDDRLLVWDLVRNNQDGDVNVGYRRNRGLGRGFAA